METHTTRSTVRFSDPFMLSGFDAPQPAGEYQVEHDDEQVAGVSFVAQRRVATFIYLPAIAVRSEKKQMILIDPAELEVALVQDRQGT